MMKTIWHNCNGNPRKRKKEKMRQKLLKGILTKNFPKPVKNKKSIERFYKLQEGLKKKKSKILNKKQTTDENQRQRQRLKNTQRNIIHDPRGATVTLAAYCSPETRESRI